MKQNGLAITARVIVLVAVAGVAGYFLLGNQSTTNELPADWQFVDADSFTLSLPPGWTFNKLQGKDSYAGEFVGDGAKLGFDYGWYSDPLAQDGDPDYNITYETIGGYKAKIVVPKIVGNGTTGVYFDDLGGEIQKTRLQISGYNLTAFQQETVLKIFRTIKFPERSALDTANWKTYHNDKYGFEIQYPANLVPSESRTYRPQKLSTFLDVCFAPINSNKLYCEAKLYVAHNSQLNALIPKNYRSVLLAEKDNIIYVLDATSEIGSYMSSKEDIFQEMIKTFKFIELPRILDGGDCC